MAKQAQRSSGDVGRNVSTTSLGFPKHWDWRTWIDSFAKPEALARSLPPLDSCAPVLIYPLLKAPVTKPTTFPRRESHACDTRAADASQPSGVAASGRPANGPNRRSYLQGGGNSAGDAGRPKKSAGVNPRINGQRPPWQAAT